MLVFRHGQRSHRLRPLSPDSIVRQRKLYRLGHSSHCDGDYGSRSNNVEIIRQIYRSEIGEWGRWGIGNRLRKHEIGKRRWNFFEIWWHRSIDFWQGNHQHAPFIGPHRNWEHPTWKIKEFCVVWRTVHQPTLQEKTHQSHWTNQLRNGLRKGRFKRKCHPSRDQTGKDIKTGA